MPTRFRKRDTFKHYARVIRALLGTLVVAAFAFGTAVMVPQATPANATEEVIDDGTLSWGIRDEWRNYIGLGPGSAGPGATGEMFAEEGLSLNTSSIATWIDAEGAVDTEAGSGSLNYDGRLVFAGHPLPYYPHEYPVGSGKMWGMLQTFVNPSIEFTGTTTATLSFEMTQVSVIKTWPEFKEPQRIDIVDLVFNAADLAAGTVTTTSAKLTQAGSDVWANYGAYLPGVEMDPVTFSFSVAGEHADEDADSSDDAGSDDDGVDGDGDAGDGDTDAGDGDGTDAPDPIKTNLTLTANKKKITEGERLRFEATSKPAAPGTFTFKNGKNVIRAFESTDGNARYETSSLPVGTHKIAVHYEPATDEFLPAVSNEVVVVVEEAAATEVTAGSLRWGIREEWRNYIGLGPGSPGPGSKGQIFAEKPASVNKNHITTWTNGTGTIDVEAGKGTVTYEGTMTFRGHPATETAKYPGGWGMSQTYTNPRITLTSASTAVFSVEMTQTSVIQTWRTIETPVSVELLDLTFSPEDLRAGMVTTRSAKLTSAGADVWNNYGAYVEGLEMDPVTFSFVEAPLIEPDSTTIELSGGPLTVFEGDEVKLQATASPAIAGEITFKQDGKVVSAVNSKNGVANYRAANLAPGTHTFTAEFLPDDSGFLRSASNPLTIAVDETADVTATEGALHWGVRESFRSYLVGDIANGKITTMHGATQLRNNGAFNFPQAANGTDWNGNTGTVQYAGQVHFYGHGGVLDVTLANPIIKILSSGKAELRVPFGPENEIVLADIDLNAGNRQELDAGTVRFSNATAVLTKSGEAFFTDPSGQGSDQPFYHAGTELDRITFTIGEPSKYIIEDPNQPEDRPVTDPEPDPEPVKPGAAAGSLSWGISDYFAQYTTLKSGPTCPTPSRHCAGGSIYTSGVGAGWLFPQAAGSEWNEETHTGTVHFSGVVSFRGYGLTMFEVANPVITVHGPDSATLHTGYSGSYGPGSVSLNLRAANKSVDEGGAVTWSGVPVNGGLMGISTTQRIGLNSLTFTVGQANNTNFGSTVAGDDVEGVEYTAADTPPTSEGLTIVTPADRIREGGRISVRAEAFTPNDDGILVVLYRSSGEGGPILVDDGASADVWGTAHWAGTLPEGEIGDYVITLQGSSNAGAEVEILERDAESREKSAQATELEAPSQENLAAAGPAGVALWEWWASAAGLVAIAACTTVLAFRQRKNLS